MSKHIELRVIIHVDGIFKLTSKSMTWSSKPASTKKMSQLKSLVRFRPKLQKKSINHFNSKFIDV